MIYGMKSLKIVSLFLSLLLMLSSFSALGNEPRIFNTKNAGKLSMIAVLCFVGLTVKYLNHKDKETTANIRDRFGLPSNVLELQKGFDTWRLEIYKDRVFVFRNEVLYKSIEISQIPLEH